MTKAIPTPAVVAERPAIVPAALAVVETEAAMRRRHCQAIGFDPLPEPFDASARVRLVTASGRVVLKDAPWGKDCSDPYRLSNSDTIVYREWHDRAVGDVIDRPWRWQPKARYRVTACALKDRGDSLAAPNCRTATPDTLAVFVSADGDQTFSGRFNTVLFAEGILGLGHLLRTMSPLLR